MFVRPAGGVSSLVRALEAAIGAERIRTASAATDLARDAMGFVVRAGAGELPADAVVLATPASGSAQLLEELSPDVSSAMAEIRYVSTGVVLLVYEAGTSDALPDASGFVVPSGRAPMTAATFLSRKWPEPAFGTRAVLRCFVGASGSEDVLDAADEDVVGAVGRHLAALLPLPERLAAVIRCARAAVRSRAPGGWRRSPSAAARYLRRRQRLRRRRNRGHRPRATETAVRLHLAGRPNGSDRTERVR
jgi:oxygen-dependent protoporphyrinogen oxidase